MLPRSIIASVLLAAQSNKTFNLHWPYPRMFIIKMRAQYSPELDVLSVIQRTEQYCGKLDLSSENNSPRPMISEELKTGKIKH